MIVNTPPMGWNSWNTFAENINEQLVIEMADVMANEGYRDAGYEYLVIDDCWMLGDRDENDRLVPDPKKFPHGIKYVADYVHSKGLKFGIYSCAGTRTCAGFPASYEHEYIDAMTFAEWGVDFLKYDFCNYRDGDGKRAYLTMSMALRSTGRDILFSACQWGVDEPAQWMRSVGAHMYRSTGDIADDYFTFHHIVGLQQNNFALCGGGCFNDLDMLTVGMYGKGHVSRPSTMTLQEYQTQFALWCFVGSPLIMGADLRKIDDDCKAVLLNKELIRINQDKEARAPYKFGDGSIKKNPDNDYFQPGGLLTYVRQLEDNEFAIGIFNFHDVNVPEILTFAEIGVPFVSGKDIEMTDVMTGEKKIKRSESHEHIIARGFKIYRCKTVDRC